MALSDRLMQISMGISVIVHLILLLVLPGLGDLRPSVSPRWIEIDFLTDEPVEQLDTLPESSQGHSSVMADGDTRSPQGDSPLFPAPPVNAPVRIQTFDVPPPISSVMTLPGTDLPDMTGEGSSLRGLPTGDIEVSDSEQINSVGTPPAIAWEPSDTTVTASVQIDANEYPIEGPVAKRNVIFRPPLPRPVISSSGTVELKFWVRSDGTIGQIIPLVKSDSALETVAIEFLEKWRFEAFPDGTPDQWGILPLRFKLR
jgi:periplasmic protein TonB